MYHTLPIRRWGTTPYLFLRGPSVDPLWTLPTWEVGAFIIDPPLTGEETGSERWQSRAGSPRRPGFNILGADGLNLSFSYLES